MEKRATKVKKENFVCIQGWMISELRLKGNDLLVYAIIYGYSQDGSSCFSGGLQYLADWVNGTKRGVQKNLDNLMAKGLIERQQSETDKGIPVAHFAIINESLPWNAKEDMCQENDMPEDDADAENNDDGIEQSSTGYRTEFHRGIEQSSMGIELSSTGYGTEFHGGIELSSTNNIYNNKYKKAYKFFLICFLLFLKLSFICVLPHFYSVTSVVISPLMYRCNLLRIALKSGVSPSAPAAIAESVATTAALSVPPAVSVCALISL